MSNTVEIDSEAIIEARIQGESVRSISKRLGCSLEDIDDVLTRFAKITISKNLRVHTLALELERLDRLQRPFERQAEAGDIQSAMLCAKIIERRTILLGIAAPPRMDPQIIEKATAPEIDSTERIYRTIERIANMRKPDNVPDEDEPEPPVQSESEAEPD